MVDVDHATTEFRTEPVGKNLHIASEHHDVRLALTDNGKKSLLLLALVLRCHWQVLECQAVLLGYRPAHFVIGHHTYEVDGEFAVVPAVEQIDKAVVVLRHHEQGSAAVVLAAK